MLDGSANIGSNGSTHGHIAYIVDDDDAFRQSLAMLLTANDWQVEAFDSPDAFIARSPELEPGLLLLDLHLPGTSGLELLESRGGALDKFAIIMITGAGAIESAVRTIRAGAIDFIEKPFTSDELLERLNALHSTLRKVLQNKARTLAAKRRIESLSSRESDVLERLLGGASNKLIARSLDISPRTVEMHRARMVQKLGVDTTAEALELARLAGIEAVTSES